MSAVTWRVGGPPPVPPNKPRCRRCLVIGGDTETKDIRGEGSQDPKSDFVSGFETRRITLMSVLVALYIVANIFPISAFIGGAGFITAGIVVLPVMARLLRPKEALVVGFVAPLGLFALQLSIMRVFGLYGILIPALGIIFGSLGFHKSYLYPAAYVAFGAFWYIAFSGGTWLWLIPYIGVIALALTDQIHPFKVGQRADVVLHSLDATMCELVTMNIGSVSLLKLPGELWTVITPFMFFERTIAVLGSASILSALARVKSRIGLEYI